MHRLLWHYGFALLVFVALACASFLAGTAAVPHPVPDYALQAEEIYRLEIGAAFFAAFYLATMAIVLAFGGRGFAEFGPQGLKIDEVVGSPDNQTQEAIVGQQARINHRTEEELRAIGSRLETLERDLETSKRES